MINTFIYIYIYILSILYIYNICLSCICAITLYNTVYLITFMVITLFWWLALNEVSQGCIMQAVTAGNWPQAGFQMIIIHGGMVLGLNALHMGKDWFT